MGLQELRHGVPGVLPREGKEELLGKVGEICIYLF
jgi:hypothetical protein